MGVGAWIVVRSDGGTAVELGRPVRTGSATVRLLFISFKVLDDAEGILIPTGHLLVDSLYSSDPGETA